MRVHWFRSFLKDSANKMSVLKIDTVDQLADLFTKPLPKETFELLRKKLMGW